MMRPAWPTPSARLPAFVIAVPLAAAPPPSDGIPLPIVIAHRGACGYVPEHTLAAYALAIEMGADFVEPDLVMTGDAVLIARHENELSGTTDVADKPEFRARRTTKTIDGRAVDGWFSEDFTLAELKSLRARERIPHLRPANRRFDGLFSIPTFQEVLDLVRGANYRFRMAAKAAGRADCRRVGVYPETKHPGYYRGIGLPLEEPLVRLLAGRDAPFTADAVFIQSFEVGNLKLLRTMTDLPLVQLMDECGAPWDLIDAGDPRQYADMATPAGLTVIAGYADAIGVDKGMILPRSGPGGSLAPPTALVADAHAAGLRVHAWTFRAENAFLPPAFRRPGTDAAPGDIEGEVARFLAAGIDGFFTDHTDAGVRARDRFAGPHAAGDR
jgi:glycerophosphoryl diester phosphodiesterase